MGRDGADARPDRIAELMTAWARRRLNRDGVQELQEEIHAAVYPLCLRLLGSPEAAADAEQEVWRRMLAHLRRRDQAAGPIVNGAGYVYRTAEHICFDVLRQRQGHREVPVEEDSDDYTRITASPAVDEELLAGVGYTSQRLRDDLGALDVDEQLILALRQRGHSYAAIGELLHLNAGRAQRRGERAAHRFRGRIQTTVWRQRPVDEWDDPACPVLAPLKSDVQQRIARDRKIPMSLYEAIGEHLDPNPNRGRARGQNPACALCAAPFRATQHVYDVLVSQLPRLLDVDNPRRRPGELDEPDAADERPVRRSRTSPLDMIRDVVLLGRMLLAALFVVALVACCVFAGKVLTSPQDTTAQPASTVSPYVPDLCQRVTAKEVTDALGGPAFGGCRNVLSPSAPDPGPRYLSSVQFDRSDGPVQLLWSRATKFDQPAASLNAEHCEGGGIITGGRRGMVPGLGDAACYKVLDSYGADVFVRKGDLKVFVTVHIPHTGKDAAIRLARLITSRA